MANTPDFASCINGAETTLLPVSPYLALQYHFGMLLGVDDFEVSQAYPRGKIRLHNAWLHRDGVVWGFNVSFNARHELVVDPGLALDAGGHELHLDRQACLDLGKWYAVHKDEVEAWRTEHKLGAAGGQDPNHVTFPVYVVAKFKACLTRPVPAIADPCEGASTDTAYSRAFETVELFLRPGPAPRRSFADPYHRLRLLFALIEPTAGNDDDEAVVDRRKDILLLPLEEQPAAYLEAFRELAARDTLDLKPQEDPASLFPQDPSEVVLAEVLQIVLERGDHDEWSFVSADEPDVTVRSTLVATSTIQELLCGPLFGARYQTPIESPRPLDGTVVSAADAPGPRVMPGSVKLTNKKLTFQTDSALEPKSLHKDAAFSVTTFDASQGWRTLDVQHASFDDATNTVTLNLHKEPDDDDNVRLIVYGTGKHPVLGTNLVPLAGAVDGPPGTKHDGHDFVQFILKA